MHAFIDETRSVILSQQRRIGGSCDWDRLRFTMDEVSARAVREAFLRLHQRGLAYRAEALVNWCPGCRTSVSDLEVLPTPETGTLWSVRYHLLDEATGLPDPDATLTVATTRPETILGDTAVAVHPDDPRYAAIVGRRVRIPFVERDVPVIADPVVDPAFGTGAVKITPGHDHDDHETGVRHGLPMPTMLDDAARVANTGTVYDGLDRYEARTRMLEDLASPRRPRGREAPRDGHRALPAQPRRGGAAPQDPVVRADRPAGGGRAGGDPLRPDPDPPGALREGLGALADHHPRLERVAPAVVGASDPGLVLPGRPRDGQRGDRRAARLRGVRRARRAAHPGSRTSSTRGSAPGCGRSPRSAGPRQTDDLRRFYPGSVMETGYDIIFFWVARMMMLGIELIGEAPFHTVYLSGLIRDPYGQKMSKTKGNTVDPLATIEEVGADALRFAVVHGATPGNDQRFGPAKVENARNFANKLWNATRFVLGARPTTIPADSERRLPDATRLGPAERWVLSRAVATTAAVDKAMADYAFGEVTRILYEATWNEYCDWGLELAKVRLNDASLPDAEREATWWALVEALDTYLRLLHPVMPFLTEQLWQALPHRATDPDLLIVARWPGAGERDEAAEAAVGALVELVRGVRNARADAKLEPGAWLPLDVYVEPELASALEALRPGLERLAHVRPLRRHLTREDLHGTAGTVGGLAVIAGPVEAVVGTGVADPDAAEADRARLEKELGDAERLLDAARSRLANEAFISKAPPAIVAGARASEAELADQVERLRERLGR